MIRAHTRASFRAYTRASTLLLAFVPLSCAKSALKVCPISLVDGHADVLMLRDNPMPDEFERVASAAWVDARPVSAPAAAESECSMHQVIARARVAPGVHRVVVASAYRGHGMWSGASWRACQELELRVSGAQQVVVRSTLRRRIAVDPFERLDFDLRVEPPEARIGVTSEADDATPAARELCRALPGYEELAPAAQP